MSQAPQITPVGSTAKLPTLEEFVSLHQSQLEAIKLPKLLWKVLHRKLFAPKLIHDDDAFELVHIPEGGYQLKAKKAIRKSGDVFIVPHACEGSDESLFQLFKAAPSLVEYLANMTDLDLSTLDPVKQREQREQLMVRATELITKAETEKVSKLEGIDDEMVDTVMDQAEVDRTRAEAALIEFQGDLIAAIADCLMTPEHKQLEAHMNKNLFSHQAEMKGESVDFDASQKKEEEFRRTQEEAKQARELLEKLEQFHIQEETRAPITEGEKYLQRCAHVYQSLFKNHFVGLYYSMRPRDPKANDTGPVKPEEVIKNYYVMEEMGSAILGSKEPNVMVEVFICLSSGNSSWSIVVPTRDIKAGEIIQRAPLRAVQCPLEFKW